MGEDEVSAPAARAASPHVEREWRVVVQQRRTGAAPKPLYVGSLPEDHARSECARFADSATADAWVESREVGPWERTS